MKDKEAFKRWEMCTVCGARVCHEGDRIGGVKE